MALYPTTSRSLSLRFGIDVRSTRAKGATQQARFCFLFPPFAQEVLSAPRSPWQRAYVERVIGSLRRECLNHVIVFHELSLRESWPLISSTITDRERIFRRKRT